MSSFAQGHTASQGAIVDSNPGLCDPKATSPKGQSLDVVAHEVNSACRYVLFGPNIALKGGKFHIKVQISGFSLETRFGNPGPTFPLDHD